MPKRSQTEFEFFISKQNEKLNLVD